MGRSVLLLLVVAFLTTTAGAHAQVHIASQGVEFVTNERTGGSGQAAAVAGNRLIVAGPSHLTVYDISDPASPALMGAAPLDAANESEDVVTNGRIAAISSPACRDAPGGCVAIYDVSGEGNPTRISSLALGAQVASCVDDCRRLWVTGSNTIVDLSDPASPREVGSFLANVDSDTLQGGCFQAREVRPGLVLVACTPTLLLSTLPQHGGSPDEPVELARAIPPDFDYFLAGAPHSAHWPRAGADRFLLTSTETPFHAECTEDIGAFITWDARPVTAGGERFVQVAEWRPANGTFTDGRSPYNAVGCSPHFMDEHPSFRDGGLVAVAALENGVRLLQVKPDGAIEERGWFLGLGATAAVPVWHPDGQILYVADYARGLDVIRYTGDMFVPPAATSPDAPAPPPASGPERAFRLAGIQLDRRRGRATLAVEVPAAGSVVARADAARRRLRPVRARAAGPGLVRLTIGATGRARRTLSRRGRLPLRVRVTFRPAAGGKARSLRARTTLRLRRR